MYVSPYNSMTAVRRALGPTQPPIQWVSQVISLVDKETGQ